MKYLRLKRLYGLILVGCFSILHVPIAFAVANDTISNQATLSFTVGGGPANILESDPLGNAVLGVGAGANTTDFIEDRVVNFTVAEVGGATTLVAPSATLQVQTFTVTNNGNSIQDFLLTALDTSGTVDPWSLVNDSFDPTLVQVFVENGNTVGFQGTGGAPAQDTGIYIDELTWDPAGSGNVITVYVVSTIPAVGLPLVDGDVSVLALVAQVAVGGTASTQGAAITNDDNGRISAAGTYSNGGTAVAAGTASTTADNAALMDTVFNDPLGVLESDGTAGVLGNGQHSAYDSYTVGAALVTVTKTAAILWDPVNGSSNPKAIPGAYMRYTVTVTNDVLAGASADLTTLSDTLQSGASGALVLDPDYVDGSAAAGATAAAILATSTNGAGEAYDVALTGTTRTVDPVSCSGDAADADADGCGTAGQITTLTFTTLLPIEDVAPLGSDAGEDYTAGELKPGDTVTIMFNAIVQ